MREYNIVLVCFLKFCHIMYQMLLSGQFILSVSKILFAPVGLIIYSFLRRSQPHLQILVRFRPSRFARAMTRLESNFGFFWYSFSRTICCCSLRWRRRRRLPVLCTPSSLLSTSADFVPSWPCLYFEPDYDSFASSENQAYAACASKPVVYGALPRNWIGAGYAIGPQGAKNRALICAAQLSSSKLPWLIVCAMLPEKLTSCLWSVGDGRTLVFSYWLQALT